MTYRTIHGLTFKVFSPSLYELCSRDDGGDISIVALSYDGIRWYINVLMKRGHTISRGPFRSRDDAVALIAGRIAA